ncbi:Gas vesicle protein [Halalkalicoccus paucihalophilus]|uniref:Gas vesicle protein n=1 Tax=Halalkalicoccus paucihalophilus TaxID=1008153 RepID=A0A151AE76_9EURY|nr:gas vesicle protein [Halalkalicoccus paucihalophilus]KYH25852.1 Gas vesicle protein [Halalkalicoccus paucihalophilus]
MEPTRPEGHAIVDVLDVLLTKGAIVQADVVVTVADIPLVGINLRAAIAGMTTMVEHGMFTEWDEEIRNQERYRHSEFGRRPRPTVPEPRSDSGSKSDSEPDER